MKKLILSLIIEITVTLTAGTYTEIFETPGTVFAENGNGEEGKENENGEENGEAETPEETEDFQRLEDMTFEVKDYLRLPGYEQPTRYFEAESPITALILSIIEFVTIIIGSIATILIIAAGFLFMISRGNEQKLTEAKDLFKYAVIGLAIAFLSYTIVIFVQSLFITT